MKTQVSFIIDQSLKKAFIKKAKKKGITFKDFFNYCLQGFLDNKIKLNSASKKKPLILEQIKFKDLPPKVQKEYLRVKDMPKKEFISL